MAGEGSGISGVHERKKIHIKKAHKLMKMNEFHKVKG